MDCQLISFSDEATRPMLMGERLRLWCDRRRKWWGVRLRKLISPSAVLRKIKSLRKETHARRLSLPVIYPRATSRTPASDCSVAGIALPTRAGLLPPLNLRAGERVRVKTLEEIYQTLDEQERYEGCTFTSPMVPHCGKEYVVLNRIERFFDERSGKLLRGKNMVILEQSHCRPSPDSMSAYAGCDRRCYLFWKEAWLERVAQTEPSGAEPVEPQGEAG